MTKSNTYDVYTDKSRKREVKSDTATGAQRDVHHDLPRGEKVTRVVKVPR